MLQSNSCSLNNEFEISRWAQEIKHSSESRQQLAMDEIGLMLKRICLDGWPQLLVNRQDKSIKKGVLKHSQFYVSQIVEYIATHHNQPLTVKDIAEHIGLRSNYVMNVFQRTMQMTIKQYITAMRINHARALLSDTDRTILDISLTVASIRAADSIKASKHTLVSRRLNMENYLGKSTDGAAMGPDRYMTLRKVRVMGKGR